MALANILTRRLRTLLGATIVTIRNQDTAHRVLHNRFLRYDRNPRVFFNRPKNRSVAFAFFACALVSSVVLGTFIRKANYVDADGQNISKGGIVVNPAAKAGSLLLMGDSHGSMYGKTVKKIALDLGKKLNVISVAGNDPLPSASAGPTQLWLDSFSFIQHEHPDVVLLVCNWQVRLKDDRDRLSLAVKALEPFTNRIILITEPPQLPKTASRDAIRNGSRAPFIEDQVERSARLEANSLVRGLQGGKVTVIDIESLFADSAGSIRFVDSTNHQLFQDVDHLSGFGADLVGQQIANSILPNLR